MVIGTLFTNTYPMCVCLSCFLYFHTRPCVLNHIKYRSEACKDVLVHRPDVITQFEASQLDSDNAENMRSLAARSHKRSKAFEPCHQLSGPKLFLELYVATL